jgi:hypothetical protein
VYAIAARQAAYKLLMIALAKHRPRYRKCVTVLRVCLSAFVFMFVCVRVHKARYAAVHVYDVPLSMLSSVSQVL